jgi:DNA (cytosine-5)-methyltransferase 1
VNVLELFAGIGGLSLGLERAGFHVVGQVEISPFSRAVLTRHWPEVPKHDDVRTAIDWWFSEPRPPVHCVAGGYPCQPESLAGARRGTDDERWLWPEFARIVARLRPRLVIGENVMGHRTSGLRFVLRDLERLGYTARAGVVAASEVGAPHRRQRIFVIAADTDLADAGREARRSETGYAVAGTSGAALGEWPPQSGGRGVALADAGREGLEGPGELRDPRADTGGIPADGGWWATEPDVGRVAHGVPARVDRLRALGNAVVPQVSEYVGRLALSGQWLDGGLRAAA